jgi:hypothetical protein
MSIEYEDRPIYMTEDNNDDYSDERHDLDHDKSNNDHELIEED